MELKKVGFFRDLAYGDTFEIAIKDHVGIGRCSDKYKVLLYLDAGVPFIVSPGPSRDILDKQRKIIGPLAIFTDGIYAWPADLSYYVKNYCAPLPDHFIGHMQASNWLIDYVDAHKLEMD
ncbi:hypothetical protein [Methylobacterium sp. E-066]|uniref:hypothetical protein n=1 Tax=Methylobacterium sp. E-066 TaxID=2836584 RepID=UPI001FBB9905|nr:hypothetical protein [Methylobacterium sp. E-066]MCJ2140886.1 hypothetical protein [Methylobacterium sp. E-066]